MAKARWRRVCWRPWSWRPTPRPIPAAGPKGGRRVVTFRNEHLQYAITWFALAAGLLLVYFAYHRALGRLGFRK